MNWNQILRSRIGIKINFRPFKADIIKIKMKNIGGHRMFLLWGKIK